MGKKSKDLVMKDSEYKKLIEPYKEKAIEALAGLIKIVIDPKRCPNTAIEFSEYELEKDKEYDLK